MRGERPPAGRAYRADPPSHDNCANAAYELEAVRTAEIVLDPNVLTLGFARRFTEYKRPNLVAAATATGSIDPA